MNSAIGLSYRYTLNSVNTTFKSHMTIYIIPSKQKNNLFVATQFCFISTQYLDLPAFLFCVVAIHSEKVSGKKSSFFPSSSSSDFYNSIFMVIRILRNQQFSDFFFTCLKFIFQLFQFLFSQSFQFWVRFCLQETICICKLFFQFLIVVPFRANLFQLFISSTQGFIAISIVYYRRI